MTNPQEKTPLEYYLALSSVQGLGNVRIRDLISHFGNVQAIFDAELSEIAQLPSLNPALASRILAVPNNLSTFRERLDMLRNRNIRVLPLDDPASYPARLKTIPDAPAILYSLGELTAMDRPCIAIVGTRAPTAEGIEVTRALATDLSFVGFTVVSGLAEGIDTAAHAGALAGSGETIAVLGTDVLNIYPAENRQLATDICTRGCLLSEHPFRTSPSGSTLVQRNRIITGLSIATIVMEATEKGGTMHTARFAQRQERPLLVCQWEQGHAARGGNRVLLQEGAVPFVPNDFDMVLDALRLIDYEGVPRRNDVRTLFQNCG